MFTLNCKGNLLLVDEPLIMGIINVTPDSFYGESRFSNIDDTLKETEKMLNDGATFIDIGAQSTRPGNKEAGIEEELRRMITVIDSLHRNFPSAIISVDTYHAKVATQAVAAGAAMVNDISGGNADPGMLATVGTLGVPYVCMHIRGIPETMHRHTEYENITREVIDYFITKLESCRSAAIHDVIIDPGFGFSKRSFQNFELLKNLPLLQVVGKPILAGLSRKSTIYKTLGVTAAQALNGTTVMNTIALLNGANILRVHDVKEAAETIKLFTAYKA